MCRVAEQPQEPPVIHIPARLLNYDENKFIESPTEFDVLCGSKSTALNNHPGNHLLRQKVASCLTTYEAARTKQQKMKINRTIVQFMRTKFGARFLKRQPDGSWALAEEQSIRDKVSHAFRYAQIQREKEQRRQQYNDDDHSRENRRVVAGTVTALPEQQPLHLSIPEPIPYHAPASSSSSSSSSSSITATAIIIIRGGASHPTSGSISDSNNLFSSASPTSRQSVVRGCQ